MPSPRKIKTGELIGSFLTPPFTLDYGRRSHLYVFKAVMDRALKKKIRVRPQKRSATLTLIENIAKKINLWGKK
jgi:hypothetical protein